MTDYILMERDFIQRTLDILDQYQEKVLGAVPPDNEYEVTLLMNCLLGLLIYPQQLANKRPGALGDWLTKVKIDDVGPQWGIKPEFIVYAGYEKIERDSSTGKLYVTEVPISKLSMRNLLRNMRNTVAHAHFQVNGNGAKIGQITTVVFKADPENGGFHLELPVDALGVFVRALAQSALEVINKANDESTRRTSTSRRAPKNPARDLFPIPHD